MPLSWQLHAFGATLAMSAPCSAERNKVRVNSRGLTGGT